jgi:hypothetical protein
MKPKIFTLTIFFTLFFSGFTIAQPWTYLFDDYEGSHDIVVGKGI